MHALLTFFLYSGDVICHEDKGGLIQRILGNSYGELVLENQWKSDSDPENIFRFCHKDHQHPIPQRLKIADLNGENVSNISINFSKSIRENRKLFFF